MYINRVDQTSFGQMFFDEKEVKKMARKWESLQIEIIFINFLQFYLFVLKNGAVKIKPGPGKLTARISAFHIGLSARISASP